MSAVTIDSPLGRLNILTGDEGVLLRVDFDRSSTEVSSPRELATLPVVRQLDDYFFGERTVFDIDYKLGGTTFQLEVWQQIAAIPFGETATYGDIARAIGKPNASRAVGAACGQNPISIIVPCHRVVGAGNKLTGYGGGLDRKKWLLAFENTP